MATAPRQQVTPLLIQWINAHVGITFTPNEVARDIDRRLESVRTALTALVRNPDSGLSKTGTYSYCYRPGDKGKTTPAGQLFELVGRDADDNPVIRDEKGTLWRVSGKV